MGSTSTILNPPSFLISVDDVFNQFCLAYVMFRLMRAVMIAACLYSKPNLAKHLKIRQSNQTPVRAPVIYASKQARKPASNSQTQTSTYVMPPCCIGFKYFTTLWSLSIKTRNCENIFLFFQFYTDFKVTIVKSFYTAITRKLLLRWSGTLSLECSQGKRVECTSE